MTAKRIPPLLLYTLLLLLTHCGGKKTLRGVFQKQTPYERYAAQLKEAHLNNTALGQDWLRAGQKALTDSITVTMPFKETGYFAADKPKALGYRINAKRGERIEVNLQLKAQEPTQVFLDLFEAAATLTQAPTPVAAADTSATFLSYEVENDSQHILRVQPELLRSGQYTVTIQAKPTLAFPVLGKTSRNIASVWGDPRDAGARRHEGIDIFAKRGTPALAAAPGVVSRVSVTPLGGKVVWLSDRAHHQSLYYAHLDTQLVVPGQQVQTGDTLGLIGNTGNARTTNPHLHFGIYRFHRGATNPFPYVHASGTPVPAIEADTVNLRSWVRVKPKVANIRLQPTTASEVYQTLPQHTALRVTGAAANWYRVQLPTGQEAYIAASLVEQVVKPVKYEQLTADTDLLEAANQYAAPKDSLAAGSRVAVLGSYSNYSLVRAGAGETGWIDNSGRMR